eukprot:6626988-Ditylum_brightwellii.AAC.1
MMGRTLRGRELYTITYLNLHLKIEFINWFGAAIRQYEIALVNAVVAAAALVVSLAGAGDTAV